MTSEELSIPPTEMEIGECLRWADVIKSKAIHDSIRRLAFHRDELKRRLAQTQAELDNAVNELRRLRGLVSGRAT